MKFSDTDNKIKGDRSFCELLHDALLLGKWKRFRRQRSWPNKGNIILAFACGN
jgi:hypothetical protein